MTENKMSRRELLKTSAMVFGAGAVASQLLSGFAFAAATEDSPVAKALKYEPDATKSKFRTAEKQGIKADKQFCNNCSFFQGKATDAEGKCTMIAAGPVKGKGWCNSWAKKA